MASSQCIFFVMTVYICVYVWKFGQIATFWCKHFLMSGIVFSRGSAPSHQQLFAGKLLVFFWMMEDSYSSLKHLMELLVFISQKLVIICLSGGDDRDPAKTAVKASSAAILARILVMNTTYLAQLTSEPSLSLLLQQAGVTIEDNVLICLTDIWLDKVSGALILNDNWLFNQLSGTLTGFTMGLREPFVKWSSFFNPKQ